MTEEIDVLDVDIMAEVSAGTYIRALARDLGLALGVGGHLTALRRLSAGPFTLDHVAPTSASPSPDTTAESVTPSFGSNPPGLDVSALMSLASAARLRFRIRQLSQVESGELVHGRPILAEPGLTGTRDDPVAGIGPNGELVALLADRVGRARPVAVFAS